MGKFAFMRLGDWLPKHITLFLGMFIVSIAAENLYPAEVLATVIFSIFSFSFTFSFNYYVEREMDELVGKNRVKGVSPALAYSIFGIQIAGMLSVPLAMVNVRALILSLVYLCCAIIYSVRPVHLKKRGIWSVAIQAVTLRLIPFVFFIVLIDFQDYLLIYYLSIWLILLTVNRATYHQLKDYDNDLKLNWPTFAIVLGKDRAILLTQIVVGAIYALGFIAIFLFPANIKYLILLFVALSNPHYRKPPSK